MNKQDYDILQVIVENEGTSQRMIAHNSGLSLGRINRAVRSLRENGYIDDQMQITEKTKTELRKKAPRNAIILAAGFGMRMVPINTETPKGLLELHGERLIERTIRFLKESGIEEIYVVVGFMKERFEYLIDEFGIQLVVNREYSTKNNLHSLAKVLPHLSNSYIVPCDIWCEENPFRRQELYSWYMVSEERDPESDVRVNRKEELVAVTEGEDGCKMIGISYLLEEDAVRMRERMEKFCADPQYDESFWETVLYGKSSQKIKMEIPARVVRAEKVAEINTYEQLRELDSGSAFLKTEAIDEICRALHVAPEEIVNISILKKGMTNRSFLFERKGQRYIMRIPGEGTDMLINRREEAAVYRAIADIHISDELVWINPENGYKITKYLEGTRTCDAYSESDLYKCMKKLRAFHEAGLQVEHSFDIFGKIDYYESLWKGQPSVYRDYKKTKENVLSLKPFIEEHTDTWCLTHIDAVPDNFLFSEPCCEKERESQEIHLIDWEYAGMQDPHVDIAMFCIYALYDKEHVDHLIDIYFDKKCTRETRLKIYCYIAACGLLWSNWCEYKRVYGIEFGEYSLRQYRYAKDYYKIVQRQLEK